MNHHQPPPNPTESTDCPRTRLAQGDFAAVDACRCGTVQVHLGALTLRLAPCALAELAGTLNQALAAHARRFPEHAEAHSAGRVLRHARGEA